MSEEREKIEEKKTQKKLEFYISAVGDIEQTKYGKLDDAVKAYIESNKYFKQIGFSLRGLDIEVATFADFSDNMNHILKPEDVSRLFRNATDATSEEIEDILENLERLRDPLMKDNAERQNTLDRIVHKYQITQMINGKRIYQEINEAGAKIAHGMKYYYPYIEGMQTNDYKKKVDEAYSIADQIKKIKPEAAESAYRLVNEYSKELAKNINQSIEIDRMCPSDMIAGAENIPAKKKEQQNVARSKNREEYKKIESIKEKLNNILTGRETVKSDVSNDIEKSTDKVEEQEKSSQAVKEDEIKKNELEEDRKIDSMTPEEKEDHVQVVDFAIDYGQQEYISEEDMELYEQIIEERNQVPEFDGKDNKRILSERENNTLDAPTDIDRAYDKLQELYNSDEISYEEFKKRNTILDIHNQIGSYGLEMDNTLFFSLPIERQREISQEVQKGLQSLINTDQKIYRKISYDTIKAIATQRYIYQNGKFEKASHVEIENQFFKKIENSEKMKLELVFAGKPNEEIREILKENHFNWSSKEKAWQRLLTGNARYAADIVLERFEELEKQGKFQLEKTNSSTPAYKRNRKFHGREFESSNYDHANLEKQVMLKQNKRIKEELQDDLGYKLNQSQDKLHQEQLGMVEDVNIEIEIGE